jgi:hypothetical protein
LPTNFGKVSKVTDTSKVSGSGFCSSFFTDCGTIFIFSICGEVSDVGRFGSVSSASFDP